MSSDSVKITLDRSGVAKILRGEAVADLVYAVGHAVQAEIGEDGELAEYTTDRRGVSVSVPAELQARDGLLSRAAASVGLTVKS